MVNQKNHKESLNVEDALTQSEAFIIKYKSAILIVVLAIILIIGGALAYKHLYADPREEKAQAALFKGQELFEQGRYDQALKGDSIGFAGFLNVIDQYGGTKAANLAQAYAGLSYVHLKEYENALAHLQKFSGSDQMVGPSVLGAIGNSYAQLGQLDKATSYLLKGATQADNNTISPVLLVQAGNIFEKQGKFAEALEAYTKVKEKYFNSYQALDIDKYIDRVKLQIK